MQFYKNCERGLRRFAKPVAAAVVAALTTTGGAWAQSTAADSVSANGSPATWGSGSCQGTVSSLSDGSNANPGVCYLGPLDPNFTLTFTFSPSNAQFMTGLNIWANDGSNLSDNELRQFDLEVDYFDPTTNATATLSLNDVNIGDTTDFDTPLFAAFGANLYQVSAVRMSDMVGTSPSGQVTFREVQGVYSVLPVAPEIGVVSSEGGAVSDGGTDAHGTEAAGAPRTVTYTVTNTGTDTLTLGTPTVSNPTNISGTPTVGAPGSTSLAPGESTTFDVTYTPAASGPFGFDISVPNNDADEGPYDIAVSGTANDAPGVTLAPDAGNPPNGPFNVTATFTEPVTGMTLSDFDVTNGVATGFVEVSPSVYTVIITPTDPLLPVSVIVPAAAAIDSDSAPNSASNSLGFVVVNAPSPTDLSVIESIIIEETERDIRNSIAFNQRALRQARGRHGQYLRCRAISEDALDLADGDLEDLRGCEAFRGLSIEPVFDGKFTATEKSITGNASFFAQKSSLDGRTRLAFGELSFNRYEDGDTNARLDGRVAWERVVGDDMLRGLFIGANATKSDIDDTFTGSRTGYGLNAGAYFVDELREDLYWDGFVQIGLGRNNLDLDNGTLDVDGDYATTSLQFGLAVTGEREYERFDLYPELSVAYGVTSVGDADLTATSGTGTTTDSLSVSNVALGVIRFRPEFVFEGEANRFGVVENSFSVAPSLLCETVRANSTDTDCGGGLELEWASTTDDGLGVFSARASREVVGGDTRDQLSISFERQF